MHKKKSHSNQIPIGRRRDIKTKNRFGRIFRSKNLRGEILPRIVQRASWRDGFTNIRKGISCVGKGTKLVRSSGEEKKIASVKEKEAVATERIKKEGDFSHWEN